MAESDADFSNPFKKKPGRSIDSAEKTAEEKLEVGSLTFDPRDWYYDMSGDKIMVIFNHNKYQKTRYFRGGKQPSARSGTLRDVRTLTDTFSKLGFAVTPYHDRTHDQILTILGDVCAQPHSSTCCVCVCVLTHGESGGELFASDRPYDVRDLLNKLQYGAPGLVGKPKLVLVQACRGGLVDAGQSVALDGPEADSARLPSHVDTLVLTSSVEDLFTKMSKNQDYVSWRDYRGSWLIQELCRVISATHRHLDFLQMTSLVTSLVARERESNTPGDRSTHRMKQTPETRSTLTKLLRFDLKSEL